MKIKTVTIQVGNSDDSLEQKMWSMFVLRCDEVICFACDECHFRGGPPTNVPFQNYAWIIEIQNDRIDLLKRRLSEIRAGYNQQSIAWTVGKTEFI